MFRPLSKRDIRKIVGIQFNLIKRRLEESGIKLEASDEVLDAIGEEGFDPQFGARPLKRVIQRRILNELSKEILAGNINKDAIVGITLNDHKEIEFLNIDKIAI
jgi:ATP-dependent Clp protease ATP-binding subunit ClpB